MFKQVRNNKKECPLCKTKTAGILFHLKDYDIFGCTDCKVRFSQPFIDNRTVYSNEFIKKNSLYLNCTEACNKADEIIKPFITLSGKRILDIGCGSGNFLKNLKANNEVLGIEVSASFEPSLKENGIPYRIGDLKNELSLLPDNHFDLITLWDVFEHLQELTEVAVMIKNKLKTGGVIINWTNNYDENISAFSEFTYWLSGGLFVALIKKSFNRDGGHNYNFTPGTLDKLYKKLGFSIEKTIITDTPSKKLTNSIMFQLILNIFYFLNHLSGKGKIVCHIVRKNTE